ncbi:MAG: hypothetical protein ACYTEL_16735 [Planctomycetota bacterium]
MNKPILLCIILVLVTTSAATAEPSLTNILDTLYGVSNWETVSPDEWWRNPNGSAAAVAKYAGSSQSFGYLTADDTFVVLFTVTGNGYLGGSPSAAFTQAETGPVFRFADLPSGWPLWSSDPNDNGPSGDHMKTFYVLTGPSAGNHVVAWEDTPGGEDYQDLVVEVTGVFPASPTMLIDLDIKPGSCPNPFNLGSRGVLPVAVLGTAEFDVNSIDPASVRLAGVPALRSSLEDVAAPVTDANECDCNQPGPDGHADLTLKFKTPEIVDAIAFMVGEGEYGILDSEPVVLVLTITAKLYDGTPIEGADCVVLVGRVPAWIAAKKADINEDGTVNLGDLFQLKKQWGKSSLPEE